MTCINTTYQHTYHSCHDEMLAVTIPITTTSSICGLSPTPITVTNNTSSLMTYGERISKLVELVKASANSAPRTSVWTRFRLKNVIEDNNLVDNLDIQLW